MEKLKLFICIFLLLEINTATAQYTDLVDFTGTSGAYPGAASDGCSLTPSVTGDTLYGMTFNGGANNEGLIFSYDKVMNVYTDLVDFTGLSTGNPGRYPNGSLTFVGGVLYGMTTQGGTDDYGVIFSYNPLTNVYSVLYDFTGEATGTRPFGSFTLSGGLLYGMTSEGGTYSYGNIFSFNPIGNVYSNLYSFAHGERPVGSLLLSGGIFYGMTPDGGTGDGNIFSFNPADTIYTDLVDFTGAGGAAIGRSPGGSLTLAGGLLYGVTSVGAGNYNGNLFSYDPLGGTYTDLVDFTNTGGAYPGNGPVGTLALSGDVLYGMTNTGGIGNGTLFSYNPTTSTYTDLVNFTASTGLHPGGSLIFSGGTLYGMLSGGGANNNGVLFSFNDISTGVNKINAGAGAKLFPNLNDGVFTIQLPQMSSNSLVEIYNMVGRKVFTGILASSQNSNTIDISTEPDGIYLYRISGANGGLINEGKLIIEK